MILLLSFKRFNINGLSLFISLIDRQNLDLKPVFLRQEISIRLYEFGYFFVFRYFSMLIPNLF